MQGVLRGETLSRSTNAWQAAESSQPSEIALIISNSSINVSAVKTCITGAIIPCQVQNNWDRWGKEQELHAVLCNTEDMEIQGSCWCRVKNYFSKG